MYAKRIQLTNCGPIDRLDIEFPFDGDRPKPVVLVGENGSGKSILLSHIVNGLLLEQQRAYPETPEIDAGKVFKLRSPSYVTIGREYSFARVDFEDGLGYREIQLSKRKQDNDTPPPGIDETSANDLWNLITEGDSSYLDVYPPMHTLQDSGIFSRRCTLYFPADRFEDPAWLNDQNLKYRVSRMDRRHLEGHTERKVIADSPLRDNQDWIFDLVYDFKVFELQTSPIPVPVATSPGSSVNLPFHLFRGYSGRSRALYGIVLQLVRLVLDRDTNLRLGIGPRQNRSLSVMENDETLVPNVFQLSSGEVSLLDLGLSILRDYDLTNADFRKAEDISGIVVVDEIDVHLHARYQYKVLPRLIKLFPKVQFVVTSHSPLFLIGLSEVLGNGGFALYNLPSGRTIQPEDFPEFEEVYTALAKTSRHTDEIREAVRNAQKPILFVDGSTDVKYLCKAAKLLEFESMLEDIEVRDGAGMLSKIWKGLTLHHVERNKVVVLHDPECNHSDTRANVYRRSMDKVDDHPVQKGIENLFGRETLDRALKHKPDYIDITDEHVKTVRGHREKIPESWTVNRDEKTNLCHWLCENGTIDDFREFRAIFEMLQQIFDDSE